MWPKRSALLGWCCLVAAAASASPAPTSQKSSGSVVVQGSNIYYEECGSAAVQTVVLIHDGVVDSAVWDDVWPQFCASFHTIRYDRPGFGRSPENTTSHSEVDDLLGLLQHLRVTHAVLVGSSHG